MLSIRPKWCISIHPPRAGRDKSGAIVSDWESGFQSTRPVRGGTRFSKNKTGCEIISIHPPRAGRDIGRNSRQNDNNYFNPPAPCGAGRYLVLMEVGSILISIHPPRAGRDQRNSAYLANLMISIHPPRAGRDGRVGQFCGGCGISIHPPRAGRDVQVGAFASRANAISIHPPRAGRDLARFPTYLQCFDFNPPAPCGAGPRTIFSVRPYRRFQSTRPVRGGTAIMHKIYPMHSCTMHNPACS